MPDAPHSFESPGISNLSNDSAASHTIDHRPWDRLLHRYVADGRVDYLAFLQQRDRLDEYLQGLQEVSREQLLGLPDSEQQAFWINAYNSFTVAMILDHYPVDGIFDVVPLWKRAVGGSPFKLQWIPLGPAHPSQPWDGELSLDDIEHGILRTRWAEPRIHFALVCASRGCPVLRSRAYRGADLEAQLDSAATGFLADRDKNRYDAVDHRLYLSPIFRWFRQDFRARNGSTRLRSPLLTARRPPSPACASATAGNLLPGLRLDP